MKKLQDKVVIISGGGSGIGLAAAHLFQEEGAYLTIFGRNQEKLTQASKTLGKEILVLQGDITDSEDRKNIIEQTHKKWGKIDVLFLNAGIAKAAPIEQVSEDLFDEVMNINFKAPYFFVQEALPLMNDQGSIVLNTSISNQIGQHSLSVYAASKAALRSLARTLSTELLNRKIRVNVVSPGVTQTPILNMPGLSAEGVQEMIKALAAKNPMQRIGEAEEIAKVALFLASEDSSYVLGAEIAVDGGFTQLMLT